MAFKEGDRVEVTRDLEGHGIQIKRGRQGTYRGTHPHELQGKEVGHVNLDDDGDAVRTIETEDLREV